MSQAKTGARSKTAQPKPQAGRFARQEVLTLGEAAAYLRVPDSEVLRLATYGGLPGRQIADEWRFLKAAVQDWLRGASAQDFLRTHAGALKGDPYLDEMLKDIYSARGRPMVEER